MRQEQERIRTEENVKRMTAEGASAEAIQVEKRRGQIAMERIAIDAKRRPSASWNPFNVEGTSALANAAKGMKTTPTRWADPNAKSTAPRVSQGETPWDKQLREAGEKSLMESTTATKDGINTSLLTQYTRELLELNKKGQAAMYANG
jgi:hypothetical protein